MVLQNFPSQWEIQSAQRLFLSLRFFSFFLGLCLLAATSASPLFAQDEKDQATPASERPGSLIRIPLPVTSKIADQVKLSLKRIAEKTPDATKAEDRFLVVLEFDTARGKTGGGSELEACQSLARFLSSREMNRIETVAYVSADPRDDSTGQLIGHAVLIAVAANQIALDKGASIGRAGIDEENVDTLVRDIYRGLASQRLTLPVPMVMSMLEKEQQLFRVRTTENTIFCNLAEMEELEASGKVLESNQITDKGQFTSLTAEQLADFRFPRVQTVADKKELASRFNLAAYALESGPAGEAWRAVEVNLPPVIDARTVQWVMRALTAEFASAKPPNLIIVNLDDNLGNLDACLDLSRYLVDLDENTIQSVAFVKGHSRGSVGLVALSCDQLILAPDARVGGKIDGGELGELTADDLADLQPMIELLGRDKQGDWSLMMAMLDPNLPVSRYRHIQTGQLRLLSAAELANLESPDDWNELGPVDTENGLTAEAAEQALVARTIANDAEQVFAFYQLEEVPRSLQPSATDRYIERAATFLTNPGIAMLLLFCGMFLLSSELSAPGLGVPGFLSAICFLLFFWSQYLGGNADWLEIMLFVAGVVFVAIEIFLTPGIGVFGIGGMIMIAVSLVLASQTFLIPTSSKQWAQLPSSLLPLLGAGCGLFAAAFALRRVLPNSPFFRNLMLDPESRKRELGIDDEVDRDSVVDWSHLAGKQGVAITRCIPSGKVRIDGKVYDVISDGRMIDKGQSVTVTEAIGNRVVVKPAEA